MILLNFYAGLERWIIIFIFFEHKVKQKQIDTAKKLLSEVDDVDDDSQGIFDASVNIRRLREELSR